jgi:uncharacterized protein
VARVGLEHLGKGPVHNWSLGDDEAGRAPNSAAARHERVRMVAAASRSVFGSKQA